MTRPDEQPTPPVPPCHTILVTGATGLVGANVCQLAIEQGRAVRALVRPGSDPEGLLEIGVEIHRGDVSDEVGLLSAFVGIDGVVHAAGIVPGVRPDVFTYEDHLRINVEGTRNVLRAAHSVDAPAIALATIGVLPWGKTITEYADLSAPSPQEIPYVTAKRLSVEQAVAMGRSGQKVSIVFPGGVYGPSRCPSRALAPTSFDAEILAALRGELKSFLGLRMPWVLARDVADVSLRALDRRGRGERFLALGDPADVMTIPEFLSKACELAGSAHRVVPDPVGGPDASSDEFTGLSLLTDAEREDPFFDRTLTAEALGDRPHRLESGLRETIDWLREIGRI